MFFAGLKLFWKGNVMSRYVVPLLLALLATTAWANTPVVIDDFEAGNPYVSVNGLSVPNWTYVEETALPTANTLGGYRLTEVSINPAPGDSLTTGDAVEGQIITDISGGHSMRFLATSEFGDSIVATGMVGYGSIINGAYAMNANLLGDTGDPNTGLLLDIKYAKAVNGAVDVQLISGLESASLQIPFSGIITDDSLFIPFANLLADNPNVDLQAIDAVGITLYGENTPEVILGSIIATTAPIPEPAAIGMLTLALACFRRR